MKDLENLENRYREYVQEAKPKLQKFEKIRVLSLIITSIIIVLVLTLAIRIILSTFNLFGPYNNFGYISIGLETLTFISIIKLLWVTAIKSIERKIKKEAMPILINSIPDFYWTQKSIPPEEINKSQILNLENDFFQILDDGFVGKFKDVKIVINEWLYKNKSGRLILKLEFNKNFSGHTTIKHKALLTTSDTTKTRIRLEDSAFNNKYIVHSTDEIEARYIITTAFIKRFKEIKKAFNAKSINCSFIDNSMYMYIYTKKDFFSICNSLITPLTKQNCIDKIFNEISSILALIDHFKLDKKLGL